MKRMVAGARRPLNTRSDIHPQAMVPGMAAYSYSAQPTLDWLNVKPFAVCRYVGIQFTTPYRTKYTNAFATAIAHKYRLPSTCSTKISRYVKVRSLSALYAGG